MITADYRGERGVPNGQKSNVIICEWSLSNSLWGSMEGYPWKL